MQPLSLKSIKDSITHWYIPLLVGLFFVIISAVIFGSPGGSLVTLSLLFAISFIFGGVSEILFAISSRHKLANWGWSLAFGIITLIVGLALMGNLALSMNVLVYYIGFLLFFRSISAISFALDVKRYGSRNWGGLLAFGILGAVFSFILLWNPALAGMGIVIWAGLSFLFVGLFSIFLSIQLRKLHKHSKTLTPELRERYHQLQEDIRREWGEE